MTTVLDLYTCIDFGNTGRWK